MNNKFKIRNTLLSIEDTILKQDALCKSYLESINAKRRDVFFDILKNDTIPNDILEKIDNFCKKKEIKVIIKTPIKENFSSCFLILQCLYEDEFDELLKSI